MLNRASCRARSLHHRASIHVLSALPIARRLSWHHALLTGTTLTRLARTRPASTRATRGYANTPLANEASLAHRALVQHVIAIVVERVAHLRARLAGLAVFDVA